VIPPPAQSYDAFISHASEDKTSVAAPLFQQLTTLGYRIWYDKAVLTLGDSLRQKIDEGLRVSRFGVVILSPSFFAKRWTQLELDGLTARETTTGDKVILPLWHDVSHADVLGYSPSLAGRLGASTANGLEAVLAQIVEVLGPKVLTQPPTPRTLAMLSTEELEALRREALRGETPKCPEDGGILRLVRMDDLETIGAFSARCPICGKGAQLLPPA
jgi:TIR domain